MVEVYKKFTKADAESRSIVKANTADSETINNSIQSFISFFKGKHLS